MDNGTSNNVSAIDITISKVGKATKITFENDESDFVETPGRKSIKYENFVTVSH